MKFLSYVLMANDLKKKRKEIALEKYTAFANRPVQSKINQIKVFQVIHSFTLLGFKTQNMKIELNGAN